MLIQALQKVYRKPTYVILALVISMMIFAFTVWLPNLRLIASVITSSDVPFVSKIELPLSLLGSITTNFTLFSASYTITISILFGVYVGMMTYFLRRRIKEVGKEMGQGGVATGFLGILSGILGVGCAACGSFLLTSLTLFSASGVLVFLPLGGSEFGVIGIILLILAIHITAKKIQNPLVCQI